MTSSFQFGEEDALAGSRDRGYRWSRKLSHQPEAATQPEAAEQQDEDEFSLDDLSFQNLMWRRRVGEAEAETNTELQAEPQPEVASLRQKL